MKPLRNLSVRNKLIFLLLLPSAGLLFLQLNSIVAEFQKKQLSRHTRTQIEAFEKVLLFVHELQKEKTLQQQSKTSGDQANKIELLKQRAITDQTAQGIQRVLGETKSASIGKFITIANLQRLRSDTTTYAAEVEQINSACLREIYKLEQTQDTTLIRHFESLLAIQHAKEFLIQLRGIGNELKQNPSREDYALFASKKGKFDFNLETFRAIETPELIFYFESIFEDTPSVMRLNLRLDSILENPAASSSLMKSEMWQVDMEMAFNALKQVSDYTLDRMKQILDEEQTAIQSMIIRKIALTVLMAFIILMLARVVINAVVDAVEEIQKATNRISKGDIDFALQPKTGDELGQLAESFNHMITVLQDYIHVANAIGRGDYVTDIKLRTDNDLLGRAFISMRDNLHSLSIEKERQTWLLKGNNELHSKLREEKDIRSLAQDIITQLANYLKAHVGAVYLLENGLLNRVGCYGLDGRKTPDKFEVGQSLVGQAALEKKPLVVDMLPPDYIKISSGLGEALPNNIIVFPFFYVGRVKGVVELGSTRNFTDLDIEFLQLIGNSISIAFNSSQSRSKLKDLLEETQRQAEELESQQEELRQFNDELLEKLNSIERSEAALKVQQEELQRSNIELEEAANMLENEKQILEKAKAVVEVKAQNLESVSRYKSEFLANMSHELRTPLNSILILTQMLIENKNGTLNEKEVKYANVIYNSGNELLTLINDILDLSKVESGRMDVSPHDVSVEEIVSDMNMMFMQVAKSKSINFQILSFETNDTIVYTDRQRLEQILRNLLSNAFKFTPSGGSVKLLIKKFSTSHLSLKKLQSVDNVIAFSVVDTGIGIPKEKQEIIFEAFRQVDSTDKRKYGGTGLGLSICRELCNLLGGEIVVQSQEGEGSTFTLYLPLNYSPVRDVLGDSPPKYELKHVAEIISQHTDPVADDRENIQPNDRRILILEDDKEFAQVMLEFVRERNYKGIIAYQGNAGLSYARHYKPDAILLDMKLPMMDGEDVIRQLKNDPALRHIPVQIISGYSRRKEAMALGAFDFVKKPVSREKLLSVFQRLEDFTNRKYKKLLVVENVVEQNKVFCDLIGNGDVECYAAYSAQDALEKLNDGVFDCIIVDAILSDMTGIQLLEKIKSDPNINKIPVILFSAKDLSPEEHKKLGELANLVTIKTAYSHERLLDEATLFLHRVEANLPKEKQKILRKLHRSDEVLREKIVLIVDDDMRNIYSLTNVLEEEGMTCLTAATGREAIEVINKNESVHIILMDVMMPEMDGYEATMEIRKIKGFAKIPIIALTAKAMKGDREKCLAAGMSDYITKPVDIGQLLSLMRVWLYNRG